MAVAGWVEEGSVCGVRAGRSAGAVGPGAARQATLVAGGLVYPMALDQCHG